MEENKDSQVVNCSDIPNKVKLIGRFGLPLGEETITIRGKWEKNPNAEKPYYDPTKTSSFNFVVTSINGKAIQKTIEIPWQSVEPLCPRGRMTDISGVRKWMADLGSRARERLPEAFDGDEWEMKGFEAGHTMGWPREIGNMYSHLQYQFGPGAFVNTFCFVTLRTFGKPHNKSEVAGYRLGHDEAPDAEEIEDSSESIPPPKGGGTF